MKVFTFFFVFTLVALSSATSIDLTEQNTAESHSKEETIFIDGVPVNELVRRALRSKDGKITFEVKNDGGQTSIVVNGESKVWSSKNGYVTVEAGVNQPVGGNAAGHFGIKGEINW